MKKLQGIVRIGRFIFAESNTCGHLDRHYDKVSLIRRPVTFPVNSLQKLDRYRFKQSDNMYIFGIPYLLNLTLSWRYIILLMLAK